MEPLSKIATVVIGSLNTDISAVGLSRFPKAGESIYAKELKIGPGGKSRNIADMIGHLSNPSSVAMVGKTIRDAYGLYQLPLQALQATGINTAYIKVLNSSKQLPSMALIAVTETGENQIIVTPGISHDFSKDDIDKSLPALEAAAKNSGFLVLTLECPIKTVEYALAKAAGLKLRVLFDPGGITDDTNLEKVIGAGIYFAKPNEHEAKVLSGIEVKDFDSAKAAAKKIRGRDIDNVLISHGPKGAYLFTKSIAKHIKAPSLKASTVKDATGCGDQTMAALTVCLQKGLSMERAAEIAVLAGTLQFHKLGIQPVTKRQLQKFVNFD